MAGRRRVSDPAVRLSKALSYLLRHGAEKEGFKLLPGGFLYLDEILKHKNFHSDSVGDIQQIVETNDKKRFSLEAEAETGRLKIRANQGHSLEVNDLDLKPITDASDYPIVIHGTYDKAYNFIAKQGLKRMGRNHVHFAAGEPGEDGVISGMRASCRVVIYMNLMRALQDGLKFYLSANNVILCPGNEDGVIATAYFDKVIDRKTGQMLHSHSKNLSGVTSSFQREDKSDDKEAITAEDIADGFDVKKSRRKKKINKDKEDK